MTKTKKKPPVQRCESHDVPEGKVYRTIKEAMGISRERVCPKCGKHYWTAELTQEIIAFMKAEQEEKFARCDADRIAYRGMIEAASEAIMNYELTIQNLKKAIE